jgi:hypothetical protein
MVGVERGVGLQRYRLREAYTGYVFGRLIKHEPTAYERGP